LFKRIRFPLMLITLSILCIHERVERLSWCGNSPDLNAIEPAWPWLKRRTTKKGAPKNKSEAN
jgi:transposase